MFARKMQRLTNIEPCRGGYYAPAGFAVACGYSLCRGRRLDAPYKGIEKTAEQKSIDSILVTDFLTIIGDNFVFILFG